MTPDIRLVVLYSGAEPVHPDAFHVAFANMDDDELSMLAAEALADWPVEADTSVDFEQANYERMPECGVSVVFDGELLAEPGCCSTLSGAIALRDFMLTPERGTHTVFTGHDVMSFLQLRFDPLGADHIELLVGPSQELSTRFNFSPSDAQALAEQLTAEIDSTIQRLTNALPLSVPGPMRDSAAEYLLGIGQTKFW